MLFKNREDAGNQLAPLLGAYRDAKNTVVLGLARGGVVTAAAVARALHLPLDVMIVKKLGAPDQEELAIGAVAATGDRVLNKQLIDSMHVPLDYMERVTAKARKECDHRVALYRKAYPAVEVKKQTVLLIDDGIATGVTMEAAIKASRTLGAQKVIVAVPMLPADTVQSMRKHADELVFVSAPEYFGAVGSFYDYFPQVEHEEVIRILEEFLERPKL